MCRPWRLKNNQGGVVPPPPRPHGCPQGCGTLSCTGITLGAPGAPPGHGGQQDVGLLPFGEVVVGGGGAAEAALGILPSQQGMLSPALQTCLRLAQLLQQAAIRSHCW